MSYTLNKTGAQIDVILNRAQAGGTIDQDIAAEAAARAAADALKAPLASPALTGTPTAPTAPAGTNTTQLATTAFVKAAAEAAASGKQDKLSGVAGQVVGFDASGNAVAVTPDATPTENSTNLVTSGGVFDAVKNAVPKYTASNDPDNSSFAIQVSDALAGAAKPTLYGKSAVVNQLCENGNFADASGWGSNASASIAVSGNVLTLTTNATSTAHRVYRSVSVPAGHVCYISATVRPSAQNPIRVGLGTSNSTPLVSVSVTAPANAWTQIQGIVTPSEVAYLLVGIKEETDSGVTLDIKNVNLIDLTAIFGTSAPSTVADLKTAWLAKLGYPLPQYIPYNAGSIVSNNATYQMHGRNIWDEEWELGGYNLTTGEPDTATNQIRSKSANPIKVQPSTAYCFYNASARISQVLWYDANGAFIRNTANASANPFVTTSPDNAAFCKIQCPVAYGTTYKGDICANVSDASFNGHYEAYYNGGSVTADNLNGIGTALDSQDAEGNIVRRIGSVDLGTLNWLYSSSQNLFYAALSGPRANTSNTICHRYQTVSLSTLANSGVDKAMAYGWIVSNSCINIRDTAYSDAATFKAAMSGVMLAYELATPTTDTTSAANIQTQAGYNSLDPVAGDVQSGEAEMEYSLDIVKYIDNRLAAL